MRMQSNAMAISGTEEAQPEQTPVTSMPQTPVQTPVADLSGVPKASPQAAVARKSETSKAAEAHSALHVDDVKENNAEVAGPRS